VTNVSRVGGTTDRPLAIVGASPFNVVSKDFAFTAVPGNRVGFTGSGQSTTRGVWLLLKPLQKGNHMISSPAATLP
jgi:hypothetical protein